MMKIFNLLTIGCVILAQKEHARSADFQVEVLKLPPVRIGGQEIRAHTQGLELSGQNFYVTARQEDIKPRKALLLRATLSDTNWDVWDLTSAGDVRPAMELDHPGGMQSDGKRLWIPIAQSKPKSRAVVRVFSLERIVPGTPLKPEFEFSFDDHIGALAVSTNQNSLFGANWDTETVYVWGLDNVLKGKLTGPELWVRGLGIGGGDGSRKGIAVQDWKLTNHRLFASGLSQSDRENSSRSRLVILENCLASDFKKREISLPRQKGVELGREAMAVSDTHIYFLPEDLGVTNRLFRIPITDLLKPE
jgi:hypothetical protein